MDDDMQALLHWAGQMTADELQLLIGVARRAVTYRDGRREWTGGEEARG